VTISRCGCGRDYMTVGLEEPCTHPIASEAPQLAPAPAPAPCIPPLREPSSRASSKLSPADLRRVVLQCAERIGFTLADLRARTRSPHATAARRWVMYEAWLAGGSLTDIGTLLERNHGSVHAAVTRAQELAQVRDAA
jgi:hypothetical protein